MTIPATFVDWLECPSSKVIFKKLADKTHPLGGFQWELHNEIRPIDLYCYLYARFGPPNGFQNFLRKDDSDNLIHWEWTLAYDFGYVSIQGMNFRTEVLLLGEMPVAPTDREEFICQLKADFRKYGPRISEIRNKVLEKWVEFVNPFHRLKNAVDEMLKELAALDLKPEIDALPDSLLSDRRDECERLWNDLGVRYSKGLGICFGVRSMLPIMAEAFINLVLFVFMKNDIKGDERLRENVVRQPIDVRIKTLHINCNNFERPVDYSLEVCRKYHTMVNDRNDLVHGNVIITKLKFNEVFFNKRVPVFQEYKSMWARSIGVESGAVGLDRLESEVKTVSDMIDYVLSCLNPAGRDLITQVMSAPHLGQNIRTGGLGILFPAHLIDARLGPPISDATQ